MNALSNTIIAVRRYQRFLMPWQKAPGIIAAKLTVFLLAVFYARRMQMPDQYFTLLTLAIGGWLVGPQFWAAIQWQRHLGVLLQSEAPEIASPLLESFKVHSYLAKGIKRKLRDILPRLSREDAMNLSVEAQDMLVRLIITDMVRHASHSGVPLRPQSYRNETRQEDPNQPDDSIFYLRSLSVVGNRKHYRSIQARIHAIRGSSNSEHSTVDEIMTDWNDRLLREERASELVRPESATSDLLIASKGLHISKSGDLLISSEPEDNIQPKRPTISHAFAHDNSTGTPSPDDSITKRPDN